MEEDRASAFARESAQPLPGLRVQRVESHQEPGGADILDELDKRAGCRETGIAEHFAPRGKAERNRRCFGGGADDDLFPRAQFR
jgi:hypothetical protein